MDGLLILLGLVVLAIPVAVLYLLISHSGLKAQVAELRRELAGLRRASMADEAKPAAPVAQTTPEKDTISDDSETEPVPEPEAAADTAVPQSDAELPPAARVLAARSAAKAAQASTPATPHPPRMRPEPAGPTVFDQFLTWIAANWFYAVSALSLALAGLFLVQYGMENGLLPPAARVAAALAFGAALIGAGEFIRRRYGEGEDSATAYLPSVFSGAGIVSLFGGVLSARMLYGLVGPEMGLLGMVVVALIALVLGWFHGPLLAAVGIIGAFGAPVVLGGSNSGASPLYVYFAIVSLVGLGVDTLRRWAWVSVLTLVLAYAVGWALYVTDRNLDLPFQLYLVALALIATAVPVRSVFPDHSGGLPGAFVVQPQKADRPIFPTLLAAGALATTAVSLVPLSTRGEAEFWLSAVALGGLAALFIVWSLRGQALQDLAALPYAGFAIAVVMQGDYEDVYRAFAEAGNAGPEAAFPMSVTVLIGIAGLLSALAAWRSLSAGNYGAYWAAAAALAAPVMAVLTEMTWRPAAVIGAYPWALHGAALAILMVFWAERFARIDGPQNRLRMSFFVLSALSCISFALVMIFSEAALTAALAVTVLVAAALDRKYDLRPMSLFVAAGVVTLGYRLVADPGLDWALDAPVPEMLLSHGGAFVALTASLWMLQTRPERLSARIMLDSAMWSSGGLLISVILFRVIAFYAGDNGNTSHWGMGIYAAIWFGVALAQVQRLQIAGHRRMWMARVVFGSVFALFGLVALAMGIFLFSPLIDPWFVMGSQVVGPPVLNSLIVACLLPALVPGLALWRLTDLPVMLTRAMQGLIGALVVFWVFCTIRHVWQGAEGMPLSNGMTQPELYSYTVALLLTGAGLFYQSLARHSAMMRKAGLVVIGAAVAKVFLVDISGLDGLTRVFSLLVLGLSLAALAWLNRWAQAKSDPQGGA